MNAKKGRMTVILMRGLNVTLVGNKYHLECSGIQYKTKDYWEINLDNFQFECSKYKELFQGC